LTPYLGHLAALGTSLCWSATSLFFANAGRRVGSPVVNRTRLLMALAFVMLIHAIAYGQLLPMDAEPFRWSWLAISGVIGFVLADAMLFQAFVTVGPRLATLLMSLNPVFGALLAWAMLGESEALAAREWLGIGLAVGGVALVVTERQVQTPQSGDENPGHNMPLQRPPIAGVLLGVGSAVGQAIGLVLSKLGIVGNFPAISGNAIRLVAATVAMWLFAMMRKQAGPNFQKLREQPSVLWMVLGGTLAGPVLGVTLSLVAVRRAPVGVASTLMSLAPIILLPIDQIFFGVRIGIQATGGTLLAFAGTALLFMQG
jgi:drug/metabolite transporter (DMT)-like permease